MHADAFRYDDKHAVVVGAATGMGAATVDLLVDLGADVVALDIVEISRTDVTTGRIDLSDRVSIDAAVDALDAPIDALFMCAGVADGTPGIERINFIGHRHFIDRTLAADLMPRGSAIGFISSAAGLAWEANLDVLNDYLDTPDFDAAVAWIADAPIDIPSHYMFSKQTICAYVARESLRTIERGIRLNAILPGPTVTPLAEANAELWLTFGQDFRDKAGVEASRPDEQAGPLVFLCSDAASYVNGIVMITDAGYVAAGITESFPPAKPVVDYLFGR